MKKRKLLVPILAGLIIGQIFAEGGRPFSIINTLRFGYDDNVERDGGSGSAYVEDIIDFAFNASLSDRTDLVVKSQVKFRSDTENNLYPNLYAVLSHSVSPRLLLRFSEYYRSGDKTTGSSGGRENYFINKLGVIATYVLTEKDRLELSLDHRIRRHEEMIEDEDSTTIEAGISWARDIRPQRTRSKLSLRQRMVEYDNRESSYDATEASLEVNHTFNQQWQGTVEGGFTHICPDFPAPADNKARLEPLFKLGATYSPSPRTRITGDFIQRYSESDLSTHGGKTSREFRFGVQHDVTAKIMAKALARFVDTEYSQSDDEAGVGKADEERFDLDFRLTYKVNRLNFLEMGLRHSEKIYDDGVGDWEQNMFDVGWRVEL